MPSDEQGSRDRQDLRENLSAEQRNAPGINDWLRVKSTAERMTRRAERD